MTRQYRNMARQPLGYYCHRCKMEYDTRTGICPNCANSRDAGIWRILLFALICLMAALTFHGAKAEDRHLYLPHTPRHVDMGTVFGTAYCRSTNTPAMGVTVYFLYLEGGGTWGTANGAGQFVIIAPVGTTGVLAWHGETLTDAFTVAADPRFMYVYLGC